MRARSGASFAAAGFVAYYAAIGALAPYVPLLYESLGFGLSTIGLLAAVYAGSAMVAAPLWGATADRFGATRPVVATAAALAALAAAALALASAPLAVGLAVTALAAAMAGVSPLLDARAMEVVGAGRASYGRLRVFGSASFIVTVLLTGWIVGIGGIHAMFAVLVPALALTAVVGFRIRPGDIGAPLGRMAAVASVLRSRRLSGFLAVALLAWTSASAINAFFSIRLDDIGAPPALVGTAWAIGAVVEVPIMLAFPQLVRRVGLNALLLLGTALFAARALVIVATADPLLVTFTMAIHGAAFALVVVGGVMYVSEHAPRGAAATAQGVLGATTFGLAQIIGPGTAGLLGGWLGLPGMFAVAGLGSAAATLAMGLVLRER